MDGTSDLRPPLVRHPEFDLALEPAKVVTAPARSMVVPAQLAKKQLEGREKEDLEEVTAPPQGE